MATNPPSDSQRPEPTGWRAKLPRIPDPVRVDLPGITPQFALGVWLALATTLLVGGIAINHHLTDGLWFIDHGLADPDGRTIGTTQVQFLSTHPYDLTTASLFLGSNLLLGLSLIPALAAHRHRLRAIGWTLFGFHWATTAVNLYVAEGGDWFNAGAAMVSVFVLTYFAYQELVSERLGEENGSLRFAAAAVVLASVVWYAFLRVEFLSQWIIETVAGHTVVMLEVFGQDVAMRVDSRTGFLSAIYYPSIPGRTVIIILACTAIQSMMIFVAAALAAQHAPWNRRMTVIGVTVPVVYLLNLVRNTLIIFLWETRWLETKLGISSDESFSIAHNWVGKLGSLIALVFIALFMFRVLPEVVASVVGLLDLPRRRGPIEQMLRQLRGRPPVFDDVEQPPNVTANPGASATPGASDEGAT